MSMVYLCMTFMAGIAIGAFYFGGLFWTVRRIPEWRRPGLWVTASYFIRTAVTVLAFYLIMGGQWQRLLASLFGFVMIRMILVRRLKPARAVIGSKSSNQ